MQHCRLLVLLAFSLLYQLSQAQLHIGFLGSGTQSKTNILFEADTENLILQQEGLSSFSIQVPIEYRFQKRFSIATGLRWQRIVSSFIGRNDEDDLLFKTNALSYLGLPLQAKFRLVLKNYSLYASTGPYMAYNFGASQEERGTKQSIPLQKENFSSFDYGIWSSLGWERTLAHDLKIHLQLEYQLGMKDIDYAATNETFLESIGIGIGILLPLGTIKNH